MGGHKMTAFIRSNYKTKLPALLFKFTLTVNVDAMEMNTHLEFEATPLSHIMIKSVFFNILNLEQSKIKEKEGPVYSRWDIKVQRLFNTPFLQEFLIKDDVQNSGAEKYVTQVEKAYEIFIRVLRDDNHEVNTSLLKLLLNLYLGKIPAGSPLGPFYSMSESYTGAVLEAIYENSFSLKRFCIKSSPIDISASFILALLIKKGLITHKLFLIGNMICDFKIIFTALKGNKSLKELNLTQSNLDDSTLHSLCEAIENHPRLKILNISQNIINDKGIERLASMLESNKILRRIYLDNNVYSTIGKQRLTKVIDNNKDLWIDIFHVTNRN